MQLPTTIARARAWIVLAVALAPAASAAPIQSSIQNLVAPAANDVYLNVVTGATGTTSALAGWDLDIWNALGLWIWASASGGVVTTGQTQTNLAPGTIVDASSTLTQQPFGVADNNPGNFQLSATNFVGFAFIDEADGAQHFGWMSLIIGSTFTDRTIGEIWYEGDPRTGIAVGAGPTGVPEPSTAPLLATGIAGLVAARRRMLA